ncbi:MAG: ABC transporter ATP-binding protein/permease [Solobacterium sp.]|nr:ABC transporter ATP-binding protein/permease [Solobacterium sp.]MCH4223087.1 ABC transporter ATP-binding protein/permease [Solobacterium sp.]MCH4265681.1 ABC transporter ATP-binding protein/permease [Solobacterium sp.]
MQYRRKRPEDTRGTIRRLLSIMGHHRKMLYLVGILTAVSAVCNLWGTYMIKPIVNDVLSENGASKLVSGVIETAVVFTIGAAAAAGYTQVMAKLAQKTIYDLRRQLFDHLQSLPIRFYDQSRHGDLMSLFTNDMDTVSEALNNSFAIVIQSFVQLIGTILILIYLQAKLAVLVMAGYAIVLIWIRYSGSVSKKYFEVQQKELGSLNGYIEEMMAGQKVIKVFNHEAAAESRFHDINDQLKHAGIHAQTFAATQVPMVMTISYINYAAVAVIGGWMAIQGQMDVGSLAAYLVFVRQTALPINKFTQQTNFIMNSLAGAERIFKVLDEQPEQDEGSVVLVHAQRQQDGSLQESDQGIFAWKDTAHPQQDLVPLAGDVRFDHVVFGYRSDHPVLKGISLYAKPGQKIALVGSTGAGKTTIASLIGRFYDINDGEITYDGFDVRSIAKHSLRQSLGTVLQDTHLFTGTIEDNIRFGKPDASREEVIQAAKTASADDFITRLPDGYDTVISQDGENLSQGQRQLIAIARAAIADPPVLILDEATSSVDTRTEELIEQGMDRLMEGRTVFVIAHRLSTVRNAKAIIVLEHGTVIERGSHEDLLALKGEYYELYHGMTELS